MNLGVHIPYANEEDCISPDSHACKLVLGCQAAKEGSRYTALWPNNASIFQEPKLIPYYILGLFFFCHYRDILSHQDNLKLVLPRNRELKIIRIYIFYVYH